MARTMDDLTVPAPTWGAALKTYEREKRRVVDEGLVRGPQLRLGSGQIQVQERCFDPLLQRYRDASMEAKQRVLEERERIRHLNRAQDIQILREQPFHIITHESKLEPLAPGADPARLGGNGTGGVQPRTKENRGAFPDTTLDYNLVSNLPLSVHHWARPEERPFARERSPKARKVAAFTLKDYNILTNQYLEAHEEKLERDKQLGLREATVKYMQRNRFDPVTQQFSDPRQEERARACEHAREVESNLRCHALVPPSEKNRPTAFYGLLSHEATNPEMLRVYDTAEAARKGRYRRRYEVETTWHAQDIRAEAIDEARHVNRVGPERFEIERQRGYSILDNKAYGVSHKERPYYEPRTGTRKSVWEKVTEGRTASRGPPALAPSATSRSLGGSAPAEVLTIRLPPESHGSYPAEGRQQRSGGVRRSESVSSSVPVGPPAVGLRAPSAPPAPTIPSMAAPSRSLHHVGRGVQESGC